MALTNTKTAWGGVARFLHWAMAVLVIGLLIAGTVMVDWPDTELAIKFALYQWHKSFGLLVFALLLARLAWRLTQPVPALPDGTSRLTRRASALSHGLLYALMLALPVTGYLMTSTSTIGIPTVAFNIVPIPHVLGPDATLEAIFKTLHDVFATTLMVVVAIHVLAALKHAVIHRDGIWTRMVRGQARV